MIEEIGTIAIGFLGGIVGGILVNIVSYKFQKREEKKEEEKRYSIEYNRILKSKLHEIIDIWNKELAKKNIDCEKIQKKFGDYSDELTSIVSKAPPGFSNDMLAELQEVSISLEKIRCFSLSLSNYALFKKECQETIKKVEVVKEKLK